MSRYDDRGSGAGRPEPVVPAGLAQLLAQLAGPHDSWDRPGGYFGPLTRAYPLSVEDRAHANSLYRLGSKALLRGELLGPRPGSTKRPRQDIPVPCSGWRS
ncbi:hypothetical protein OHS33_36055 [Streptomyces sp. NBC_00536]|nr:hypothetical protein OHS33_36055 [Streptomyces sp. NBC_00536]